MASDLNPPRFRFTLRALFAVVTMLTVCTGLWTWPPGLTYGIVIHCVAPLLTLLLGVSAAKRRLAA